MGDKNIKRMQFTQNNIGGGFHIILKLLRVYIREGYVRVYEV